VCGKNPSHHPVLSGECLRDSSSTIHSLRREATGQKLIKLGSLCVYIAKISAVTNEQWGPHTEDP
ncbi:hypothetical protein OAE23_02755, partial [Synechococcus sp. AH-551-E11]|nr:hypothetical protein [Synechococcus sp. AH-551-E11]